MQLQGVMAMVLVDDIDRATRFYRDMLGFTVQMEAEEWVIFEQGVGLHVSPEPLPEINRNVNTVMLTLVVESVQNAFNELTKKGVAFFLPPIAEGGATFATFRDTENNLIQLMQF
jgi:predicted enzyme related to lactoylglutathione lyase